MSPSAIPAICYGLLLLLPTAAAVDLKDDSKDCTLETCIDDDCDNNDTTTLTLPVHEISNDTGELSSQ